MARINSDISRTEQLELAGRLKEAREYVGMSQEEVAKAIGVRRPAVSEIEAGNRHVSALELKRFAGLFGQSVEHLLGREATEPLTSASFLARAIHGLDRADQEEVARFAEFLKKSSTMKQG